MLLCRVIRLLHCEATVTSQKSATCVRGNAYASPGSCAPSRAISYADQPRTTSSHARCLVAGARRPRPRRLPLALSRSCPIPAHRQMVIGSSRAMNEFGNVLLLAGILPFPHLSGSRDLVNEPFNLSFSVLKIRHANIKRYPVRDFW